mmetsp:Transcript_19740/g.39311  ORF Transcript_19740/g.39311 Transcript_19740/m.39311 type:complete len:86 (+) Transcript_19740:816-1073(+)
MYRGINIDKKKRYYWEIFQRRNDQLETAIVNFDATAKELRRGEPFLANGIQNTGLRYKLSVFYIKEIAPVFCVAWDFVGLTCRQR